MARLAGCVLSGAILLGCGWWTFGVKKTPEIERTVSIPFPPANRVELIAIHGAWWRAVDLAASDFFHGLEAPPDPTPLEACVARRESYDFVVWEDRPGDPTRDGGAEMPAADAGSPDGGEPATSNAALPRILFVSIDLRPGACDLGESPPLDTGGQYAIDTQSWKIVGWRP